jgi:hypothetical protein
VPAERGFPDYRNISKGEIDMLHRPITMAVAFFGAWYLAYRYADRQREAARARAQPRDLQTWEGEGGGVPVGGSRTAAQVLPDQALDRRGGEAQREQAAAHTGQQGAASRLPS